MIKFLVCAFCLGTGTSSAYLGSFTGEEMQEMGEEFIEQYVGGAYDRKCDECKGERVVPGCQTEKCNEPAAIINSYWGGRTVYTNCFTHSDEAQESAACEAEGAAERAFGC